MKKLLLALMLSMFTAAAQDPPLPDAVKFCQHTNQKDEKSYCTCPTAHDGELCKSEEPLPNFCKRMCGHARDCHCCGLKK